MKRVLVEKPAGLSIKEIKEVVDVSTAKKAKIFVGYNRRFYSSVIKILSIQ